MSKLKEALKKANKLRNKNGLSPFDLIDKNYDTEKKYENGKEDKAHKAKKNGEKEHVKVNFSKTRIETVEPNVFKKNRIISFFPEHEMLEQIKNLKVQVLNRLEKSKDNCFVITSANPGEGKTFTTINLSISIAHEIHKTVLIVDADLRKPNKNHCDLAKDFFNLKVEKGLVDYLHSDAEIPELLLSPGIEKLSILPAGRFQSNSPELLSSPKMKELVKELKNRYPDRIIVFDTPSILNYTDPVVLSRYVDGVILVVEQGRTTVKQVKQSIERLDGSTVFGTILNKFK